MENKKLNYEYIFGKYWDILSDENCMELYEFFSGKINLDKTGLPDEVKNEFKLPEFDSEEDFDIAKKNTEIINDLRKKGCDVQI